MLEKIVVWRMHLCWIPEHLAQGSNTELSGKFDSYSTQLPYKSVPKQQRATHDNVGSYDRLRNYNV